MDVKKPTERVGYVDVIKTVAIISVIAIHASSPALSGFAIGTQNWYLSIFLRSLVGAAVPLFFMCSGVLFLDPNKNIPLKKMYTKYIPKIIICLAFWAVLYEGVDLLNLYRVNGYIESSQIIASVKKLLTFNTHFHLYYLYIVVIVYALTPLIRDMLANISAHRFHYLITLWFILGIFLPFAKQFYPFTKFTGIPLQYPINMTYSAIGYCIFGYYLSKFKVRKLISLCSAVIGITLVFFGTAYFSLKSNNLSTIFFEGMTPAIALIAFGVFSLTVNLFSDKRANKTVLYILSKASFCVYLVHDLFNIVFRHFGFTSALFNPILSIPIITVCNLTLCIFVYFILSKIPIVNKWLI